MPAGLYTPWKRPSDWLTLPALTSTIVFVGLIAVFDDDNNYVSLGSIAGTGSYTVDWGDGTTSSTSGAITVKHKYNYSDLSSGTLTTRGYRQAVVTITIDTGTFNGIYLTYAYSATPALPIYNANWIDVKLGSPTLANIQIGGATTINLNILENIDIQECVTSNPILTFTSLLALQQVTIPSTVSLNSTNSLFNGCVSLLAGPVFNTSSTTNMSNMFANCNSLQYVPPYITSNVTNMLGMFSFCSSLRSVPQFDTTKVTNMSTMFSGCSALTSIPYFNTSNVTTMSSFFDGCINLTTAPMLDTPKVTNTTSMFNNCYGLAIIPLYDLSNCTTTTSMFSNCISLTSVPEFNTSKVLNSNSMFLGCVNLTTFPNLNCSNVTNASSMFQNCSSLTDASNISLPSLTVSPSGLFSGCANLVTVPTTLNYSTVTTGNSLNQFATNTKLRGNISINVGASASLNSMFTQCRDLTSVSITGNSFTATGTMFNNCTNLRTVNFSNMNAVTTTTTMFNTCTNLSTLRVSNLGVTLSVASTMLNKQALETVFDDFRNNTTVQTVTITSSAGADAIISKPGSGITANSNVITMATTTGITTGMYVYGTGVQSGIPVTFTTGTNRVAYTNALTNTPLVNNDRVMFTGTSGANGVALNTTYYVVNATSTGFQLSTTLGGSVVSITSSSTGTMTIGAPTGTSLPTIVTAVNAGNIIITGVAGLTNASATLTVRSLNTTVASVKNWTVTG
jgi:surface protein